MTKRVVRSILVSVPVLLVGAGLAMAPSLHSATAPASKPAPMAMPMCTPASSAPAKSEDAFMHENAVTMDRMMAGMNVPPTGDVDRDFTRMMIPHHQGAIEMAQTVLRYGKNEELKALARGIIAKQTEEIALMRRIGGDAPAPATPAQHSHAMK
jgi:uncharacterized protein (DUF305 family)